MSSPYSLFSRFAASTAILAAAIAVLAYISFHTIRGDIFEDSFESPLDEWSTYVAGRIGTDPEIARNAARTHQMGVMLKTKEGVFAFGTDGQAVTPEHLANHHGRARSIIVEGHDQIQYTFYLQDQQPSETNYASLWALIGGLLFLLGVVYVVQWSQLRPLRWLKEGVERVSEGDLSTRVPVVRMDEIGQVGRAFNQMTGRVQQMLDDHDRLMADVSHELRSPLARMKVALEMMPEGDKRDQIAADIREMESLTTALLERERVKIRAAEGQQEEFDLVALTHAVIAGFRDMAPGVELRADSDSLLINADETLIRILLQNLIDNAVKFSLKDSATVVVALTSENGSATITVDDDGCGIPDELSDRVLKAFVKLDPSRGHRNGYGLGLNLCQRIVDAQGGELKITQRKPRGTRVTAILGGNPVTK